MICCLFAISDSPIYHYQLDHVLEMLHRHHEVLAAAYAIGKVPFLRPLAGWNLSFEDIKSSILATGACHSTKDPWSRKDGCVEHIKERRRNICKPTDLFTFIVIVLVCSSKVTAVSSE